MPVLPALKPFFDAMIAAPPGKADPNFSSAQRDAVHAMVDANYGAFSEDSAPAAHESDHRVPVGDGEITVRLYKPRDGGDRLACHVYYHGGGFFIGTLEQSDNTCRAISAGADCAVISVDYRLAPEHRFPIAAEDSYAALVWVADNAVQLGIDPARIAVGGGSAGGNLAAVVAQMARDRGGPALVAQVLEIPVTDFTSRAALDFPAEGISVEGTKVYAGYYLRDEADARDPQASPLLADNLSDLPPALVLCAEYDPLQPEGKAYADRLAKAGVAVRYLCFPGQFHGSQNMARLIPEEAAAYRGEIVSALRKAFI